MFAGTDVVGASKRSEGFPPMLPVTLVSGNNADSVPADELIEDPFGYIRRRMAPAQAAQDLLCAWGLMAHMGEWLLV